MVLNVEMIHYVIKNDVAGIIKMLGLRLRENEQKDLLMIYSYNEFIGEIEIVFDHKKYLISVKEIIEVL